MFDVRRSFGFWVLACVMRDMGYLKFENLKFEFWDAGYEARMSAYHVRRSHIAHIAHPTSHIPYRRINTYE